jgi:hypothetical protein
MAFKEESPDENRRSEYQRTSLGMKDKQLGETCIIELTGLSARNLTRSKERDKQRSKEDMEVLDVILASRVKNIYCKIRQYNPKFVVMYGFSNRNKQYYGEIAGTNDLKCGIPQKVGKTVFLADRHPLYTPYEKWIQLGKTILRESGLASVV